MNAIVTKKAPKNKHSRKRAEARNINTSGIRDVQQIVNICDAGAAMGCNGIYACVEIINGSLGDALLVRVERENIGPWILGMKPERFRCVDARRESNTVIGVELSRWTADEKSVCN